ncbi:protein of unknown function [Candidatus Hydrogenisulfobacillus filiaventi]|uniref:Uncharacterized protein n=1 Tax=Candidatus Hydrogenisulfobacillus filiaventi TaxID=2707344 RepID=A0A6F8ZIE0_9FIRM|nr:protein of unknown function [Candidatus Hydrogenisulfobacillus filiaventi]
MAGCAYPTEPMRLCGDPATVRLLMRLEPMTGTQSIIRPVSMVVNLCDRHAGMATEAISALFHDRRGPTGMAG